MVMAGPLVRRRSADVAGIRGREAKGKALVAGETDGDTVLLGPHGVPVEPRNAGWVQYDNHPFAGNEASAARQICAFI